MNLHEKNAENKYPNTIPRYINGAVRYLFIIGYAVHSLQKFSSI